MRRTGTMFVAFVTGEELRPGVWDPFLYRENGRSRTLGDNIAVSRLESETMTEAPFAPLEYKHIPKENSLTFMLESSEARVNRAMNAVGEQALLFGTMRAYLGNVVVMPKAKWLGLASPLIYPVKADFVHLVPKDGLHYFWWAYLRSPAFLHSLPVGSGGTRPRLHPEALIRTPVSVPPITVRRQVHLKLLSSAERAWKERTRIESLLRSVWD